MLPQFRSLFDRRGTAALALALSLPGLAACQQKAGSGEKVGAQAAAANPCGNYAPVLAARIPEQTGQNQVENDCAAWQAFFALNWRADPAQPGRPDPNAKP